LSTRLGVSLIIVALFLTVLLVAPAHAAPTTTEPFLPVPVTKPVPKFHRVVVKTGDTLTSLAMGAHLKSWRPIFNANKGVSNPNLLMPGWVLRIPRPGVHIKNRSLPVTRRPLEAPQEMSARVSVPPVVNWSVWDRIAQCESGGDWSINTGNGYYGGLQFDLTSWRRVGGSELPSDASKSEQIARAEALQRLQGWGSWPVCAAFMM